MLPEAARACSATGPDVPELNSYQVSARRTKVRKPTPVAPLAMYGLASSSQAVPAMSRWIQGVSPTKSRMNHAAVIDPPEGPPLLCRSANELFSSSLYSSSIGNCQVFSPSAFAAASSLLRNASLLVNAP